MDFEYDQFEDEITSKSVTKQNEKSQTTSQSIKMLQKDFQNMQIGSSITSQDEQEKNRKKSVRIVCVGPKRFSDNYFSNLEFNQIDQTIKNEMPQESECDALLDACIGKNIFSITYEKKTDQYYLIPQQKFIIQKEIDQEIELTASSKFFIGDTLFEVLQISEQICLQCLTIKEQNAVSNKVYTTFSDSVKVFKIGRTSIQFLKDDKFISREHAEIVKRNGKFFLYKSNQNANKIWACIQPEEKIILDDGLNIRIGLSCERQIKIIYL
ncbi:FHA domain protein (macronuclear) [Tetrahymena thermophila SB210]|uniref:FHA domain protein n=1 Tax=Tetrahymena thermophila (strain SB210) TaxID=312017 RepID=I7MM28_TETTS|nr:FHA domain protein [Tetrahymena thermophila SB210]EAS03852.1 FHA domain protein [Tetrahymena thermophila SB210]|eukprot:XP_001024097.1 FHA domain protein [Tetrahymena thermophila SB210]